MKVGAALMAGAAFLAALFAASALAQDKPAPRKDLVLTGDAKCTRCHDAEDNPKMVVPILRGQDKDYLVMALRAYRDDKRESTTMHKMSIVYSNAIIDDIASYYAGQSRDKR